MKNLGDKIAVVATPIAVVLGMDCIDPRTNQLKLDSNCNQAKEQLNNGVPIWDVFYDRFFTKPEK